MTGGKKESIKGIHVASTGRRLMWISRNEGEGMRTQTRSQEGKIWKLKHSLKINRIVSARSLFSFPFLFSHHYSQRALEEIKCKWGFLHFNQVQSLEWVIVIRFLSTTLIATSHFKVLQNTQRNSSSFYYSCPKLKVVAEATVDNYWNTPLTKQYKHINWNINVPDCCYHAVTPPSCPPLPSISPPFPSSSSAGSCQNLPHIWLDEHQ